MGWLHFVQLLHNENKHGSGGGKIELDLSFSIQKFCSFNLRTWLDKIYNDFSVLLWKNVGH